jgi:hypothetical protein
MEGLHRQVQMTTTTILQDLVFSLVAPWAFYGVGLLWSIITGGVTRQRQAVLLTATIAFIVFCLALTCVAEWKTLNLLWRGAPFVYSLIYAAFLVLVIGAAAKLLAAVWKI